MTARFLLRTKLRRARRELPADLRRKANADIHHSLMRHPRYRKARVVALYFAHGGEVDVNAAIDQSLACGKRVVIPRVFGTRLLFIPWHRHARTLPGRYGIARPAVRLPPVSIRNIDLVIAPVVGFDARGARLGQGGGYYDRALTIRLRSQWRRPYFLGVAFGLQCTDELLSEPWDVATDGVLHDTITTREYDT